MPEPRSTLVLVASLGFGACGVAPVTPVTEARPAPAVEATPSGAVAGAPLSDVLRELRSRTGVPGMALSVATLGGPVRTWTSGLAVVEHGVPVDTATKFRLASTSKAVTALALARLAARGVVDLDAPVESWLPELPAHLGEVTLRQLAGHLGGVRHYAAKDSLVDVTRFGSAREALALFADDPLSTPPGEDYAYSTYGFTLIAAALEAAAGVPFPELLAREVTEPLGLATPVPDDPRAVIPGRTGFYERATDGRLNRAAFVDPGYKVAGGGMLASAPDLARVGRAVLDGDLLPPAARDLLFEPQRTSAGEETGVGLAWRVGVDPLGRQVWHHEGSMGGARSALLLYPDEGLVVALLSNLSTTPFFAFESAAGVAASVLADRNTRCPRGATSTTWSGTAELDGSGTHAVLRLESEGASLRGSLELGPLPLPVDATAPVVDGWCRGFDVVLLVALGPGWGLLPVTLSPAGAGWRGSIELQGGHRLALELAGG